MYYLISTESAPGDAASRKWLEGMVQVQALDTACDVVIGSCLETGKVLAELAFGELGQLRARLMGHGI